MGRNIDLTQPLSDEDREWLEQRGKIGDLRIADELAGAAVDPDEEGGEDSETYGNWTKAQLMYEANNRDLSQAGTKADLVARLEEDDAARAAAEDDDNQQ